MTSDDGQDEQPAGWIWERIERSGRGPRPSLTHDQIARAALGIADAEGIEAVSMRKVAGRLGSGTMSLYRYVTNRDELVDLMIDAAIGEDDLPGEPSGDWRHELAEMARRSRRLARRHPWAPRFALTRPALGPNALRATERNMACVDSLGLDIDGMLDLINTVQAFALGFVQAELSEAEAQRRTGLDEQQWRARMGPYVRRLIASGRHPYFERIVIEAEDFPDSDTVFERQLAYVLDGLEVALGRRA